MKGHLFFSGGGDREDTVVLDQKFFDLIPNGGKVLYIPIALNRTAEGFADCKVWFSGCVDMHKGEKQIEVTMILMDDEIPELSQFDAIYIGGGNTYKLLTYIHDKGLNKKLPQYVENGGILYGGSAGAIILGKTVDTVNEENDANYLYHDGLNLVGGLSMICHYEEKLNEKIIASVAEIGTPIIAMPENAGFAIHPDSIEVVNEALLFSPVKTKLTKEYLESVVWKK